MRNIVFTLFFLAGCAAPKPQRAVEPPPAAEQQCAADQFVACVSGEDCARSRGKLIRAHACFEHAASACEAARCGQGCDIYRGEPKEVHCSADARFSSHMKKCAGFSNWACPEDMRCALSEEAQRADDAMGECVPKGAAAK